MIHHCPSNDCFLLFRQGKPWNSLGGTDLATETAVILAVTEARDEHRGIQVVETSRDADGIEAVSGTYLHTFSAADTFPQEFRFI